MPDDVGWGEASVGAHDRAAPSEPTRQTFRRDALDRMQSVLEADLLGADLLDVCGWRRVTAVGTAPLSQARSPETFKSR